MLDFFSHFSWGGTKICTKIYNLLATGQKASGVFISRLCRSALWVSLWSYFSGIHWTPPSSSIHSNLNWTYLRCPPPPPPPAS